MEEVLPAQNMAVRAGLPLTADTPIFSKVHITVLSGSSSADRNKATSSYQRVTACRPPEGPSISFSSVYFVIHRHVELAENLHRSPTGINVFHFENDLPERLASSTWPFAGTHCDGHAATH